MFLNCTFIELNLAQINSVQQLTQVGNNNIKIGIELIYGKILK